MLAARNWQRTFRIQRCLTAAMAERNAKERRMISKILSGAVIAGLLMAVSAPVVAYAADDAAPKTKADCKKAKGKWDKATKTCTLPK
jgi:ABC-type Fe2+-enterobactin transport system substrate-binding protein